MSKEYQNMKTGEETTKATIALQWHRRGDGVTVWDFSNGTTNYIDIKGKKPTENSYNENFEHCKGIVDSLLSYYNGDIKRCPECGEEIVRDWDDVGDKFKCPECGEIVETCDLETLSLYDYFMDNDGIYDIEYTIYSDKSYKGVRLMVACGGPNIYINTMTRNVELYWWGESAAAYILMDVVEEIDNIWSEYFSCI
jgi:predicted RNA-binding Zn-ribbon protein involved in translation (DUF1610 family)